MRLSEMTKHDSLKNVLINFFFPLKPIESKNGGKCLFSLLF